ncbi:hypothetical protein [Priestia megaterium]|uniref:hypothetical protein n=1 Tax=Priestia megaterium TaxID=1404 RepID=UPI001FB55816|nr:hypothetical protein [Priestia megaterium]
MSDIIQVLLFAFVFGVHYFLSSRANVYLGAIFPLAYLIFCGWIFTTSQVNHLIITVLLMLLGLALFIGEWAIGRENFKKKRKKELEKMKISDI